MSFPHRYIPVLFVFRNGPLVASPDDVDSQRIDFISAYCDRWCERCAFTDRCSAFACNVAVTMCGDVAEGIELAVGNARSPDDIDHDTSRALDSFANTEPSAAEIAEFTRLERSRDKRVEKSPLSRKARVYMNMATAWIDANRAIDDHPDVVIREAFQVVCWDAYFIHVKLHRALRGRDDDHDFDDHPIQNDWNGSAKVALISIKRSAHAWRALRVALDDDSAGALADGLEHLHRAVLGVFPDAMAFVRPGFDEVSGTRRARRHEGGD